MCMFDGAGYNNPDYLPELGFFNAKGGVCNGITGGFDNELDIAFKPKGKPMICYKIGAGVSNGSHMVAGLC